MPAEPVMGIYRLYDPKSGRSYVGFTRNLEGTRKRLRFELALNACSYKPLQSFYIESGGLEFEILEEYRPDAPLNDIEVEAHLAAMLLRHKTRLSASTIQVQV